MSDHIKQTIVDFEKKLAQQLAEVAKTREAINRVSELAGLPPPYPQVEEPESKGGPIRPDEFYGQTLHSAMRAFLEAREHLGPATVAEIFESLREGGYQFGSDDANNAKRVIRITLTKNSSVFHKLPNGSYGLREWYPNIPKTKKGSSDETDDDAAEEAAESEEEQE